MLPEGDLLERVAALRRSIRDDAALHKCQRGIHGVSPQTAARTSGRWRGRRVKQWAADEATVTAILPKASGNIATSQRYIFEYNQQISEYFS
jgi:hypothetical protein